MNLLFHISSEHLLETYHKLKDFLKGHEQLIFDQMAAIHPTFSSTSDPSEFNQKHQEIERIWEFSDALLGRDKAFRLIEAIWSHIQAAKGLPGISNDELIKILRFQTTVPGVTVRFTENARWQAEWIIPRPSGSPQQQSISLELYERNWGEIVPVYVVEYVHGGISLYQSGMKAVALALLTIAVEATLRDVLTTRGYEFKKGASSVDIYKYVNAKVGIVGNSYSLIFDDPMPKAVADFTPATVGTAEVSIKIRRVINRAKGRTDLSVIAPPSFIDFWSSDDVDTPAAKRVNGLGEALRIAREVVKVISPVVLPTDFDEVLSVIRNNLIHLSVNALATPLKTLDASGAITLGKFIDTPSMVFDLVRNVPNFINNQYLELRKAGYSA